MQTENLIEMCEVYKGIWKIFHISANGSVKIEKNCNFIKLKN